MRYRKKLSLLFLILLLPLLVFLFLLLFGKNKFDVPVYYQERSHATPAMCDMEYHFPYTIPHSSRLPLQGLTIIAFMEGLDEEQYSDVNFYLTRSLAAFDRGAVHWISVHTHIDKIPYMQSSRAVLLDSLSYQMEKSCYYMMGGVYNLVLVDESRRIRGYYTITLLDEVDRLETELEILSKK